MAEQLIVRVHGLQDTGNGEDEPIELTVPGTGYEKNGMHYICYDEYLEGFEKPVKNFIRFSENEMEVRKSGVVNTVMRFVPGQKVITLYQTPYGPIEMGIDTHVLKIERKERATRLFAEYELDMDGAHAADCRLSIRTETV